MIYPSLYWTLYPRKMYFKVYHVYIYCYRLEKDTNFNYFLIRVIKLLCVSSTTS